MPYAPEAAPLRKLPHIWTLVGVSYGSVIAVTIAAVLVYRHYGPAVSAAETELEQKSARISVGDVWVPIYPGAIHQGMTSSSHDGVVEGDLRFTSSDAPAKLIAFYRARLRSDYRVLYTATENGGRIEALGGRGKSIALIFAALGSGCDAQVHTRAVQKKP